MDVVMALILFNAMLQWLVNYSIKDIASFQTKWILALFKAHYNYACQCSKKEYKFNAMQ